MRATLKLWCLGLIFGYFAACAPVKFEGLTEPSVGPSGSICPKTCSGQTCVLNCKVERISGSSPVDILIVNDNSGSMSTVQSKFATAFGGFLDDLETAALDYRIAMTTTDISSNPDYGSQRFGPEFISRNNGPSPYNGQGALQDGNLIDFGSGNKYLTSSVSNRDALFMSAVQRPETLHCEQSGFDECPSDDERAIFALNLVADRTADQFMRTSSALAVIILANEDERGYSHLHPQYDSSGFSDFYPATEFDKPEVFVDRFRTKYPGKTLSVHSIIVKPGDHACRHEVSDPSLDIFAKEGYAYKKLSDLTSGTVGSICDSSYTSQLQAIGNNIQQQVMALPFACRPDGDNFTVTLEPNQSVTWTVDWTAMQLKINELLPAGTTVTLRYSCTVPN